MANHNDPANKTPNPQPPPTTEDARAKLDALLAAVTKERAAIAEEVAALRDLIREQAAERARAYQNPPPRLPPLRIPYAIVRATAGERTGPIADAIGDEACASWLLPFSPADGGECTLAPGARMRHATGVSLILPPGVICRVSYALYRGRPGLLIPCLEIDHRANGEEVVAPLRNDHASAAHFCPGQHYLTARFERVGAGAVEAELVLHRP